MAEHQLNGELHPGLHLYTYSMFKSRFVDDFPDSKTRWELNNKALLWLAEVKRHTRPKEVWFNGAFISEDNQPLKIEFCVFIDQDLLNESLVEDCLQLQRMSYKYKCEAYFGLAARTEDADLDVIGKDFWMEQFGFDHSGQPQAIIVLPWEEIESALQ